MALARTQVGTSVTVSDQTEGTGHDGTFDVSTPLGGSVTAGDLIIVVCGGTSGNITTAGVWSAPAKSSGTATIGAVTEITPEARVATVFTATIRAWQFQVTGSGTLTISYGDALASFGPGIIVTKYAPGFNTGTPVVGVISDAEAATTLTPGTATLAETPTVDDEVHCYIDWDSNAAAGKGVTAGSGFTERAFAGSSTDFVEFQLATRTGSTSTSVPWPTEDGTPATFSTAGIAFIVKAAAAATPPPLASRVSSAIDSGVVDLRGLIRGAILGAIVVATAMVPIRVTPVNLATPLEALSGVVRSGIRVDVAPTAPIVPDRITSVVVADADPLLAVVRRGIKVDPTPIVPARISSRVADDDVLSGVVRRAIQVDLVAAGPIVTGRLSSRPADDEAVLRPVVRVGFAVAQVQPAPYAPDTVTPVALAAEGPLPSGVVRRGIPIQLVVGSPIVPVRVVPAVLAAPVDQVGRVRAGLAATTSSNTTLIIVGSLKLRDITEPRTTSDTTAGRVTTDTTAARTSSTSDPERATLAGATRRALIEAT